MLEGDLFASNKDYVRKQIIYCLLQVRSCGAAGWLLGEMHELIWFQEDDNPTLHITAAFLLFDGRKSNDDEIFEMMHSEGTFARLVELVQTPSIQEDTRLHQLLLQLLYESSRIQRLTREDFSMSQEDGLAIFPFRADADISITVAVNDAFIIYLLEIIECASDDADDPYHYPVIRVLVCRIYTIQY
jgi:hypothetical protein